jgi:hypothetical protein
MRHSIVALVERLTEIQSLTYSGQSLENLHPIGSVDFSCASYTTYVHRAAAREWKGHGLARMAIKSAAPVRDDPSLYTKCADRDGERASRATIILVGAVIRPLLPRKMKVALSALRVAMKFRLLAFRSAQYGSIGFW